MTLTRDELVSRIESLRRAESHARARGLARDLEPYVATLDAELRQKLAAALESLGLDASLARAPVSLGVGSMAGMALLSALSVPLTLSAKFLGWDHRGLQVGIGVVAPGLARDRTSSCSNEFSSIEKDPGHVERDPEFLSDQKAGCFAVSPIPSWVEARQRTPRYQTQFPLCSPYPLAFSTGPCST